MENIIINKTNIAAGMFITLATYFLGQYWFLFAAFLVLNLIDYVTGWIKAKYFLKNESSATGAKGVAKKVLYWFMILIAFLISTAFGEIGTMLGVDLNFLSFIGYMTLATYIINEMRSIIENVYEMTDKAPKWLIKGLEIVENKLELETEEKIGKKGE